MTSSLRSHARASAWLTAAAALLVASSGCREDDAQDGPAKQVEIPQFNNALQIEDQRPEDLSLIVVERVELDSPGFIVIREALSNGAPGQAIGVLPVRQSAEDLQVMLKRPARFGERLFATLHVESNDPEALVFEFDETPGLDPPALNDQGLPVAVSFTIGAPERAAISAEDQSVTGRIWAESVVIASIVSPFERAFVAVHASPDDLSAPLGFAPLEAFTAEAFPIALSGVAPHHATLYAALHEDRGVAGEFEPGGEDEVARDEAGAPVIDAFKVRLEPAPAAALICTATRLSCDRPITELPVSIEYEADHEGSLLIEYETLDGERERAIAPISSEDTALDRAVTLPTPAACPSTFTLNLMVDVEGVDLLTAALESLPYATNADGKRALCEVTLELEQLGALVDAVVVRSGRHAHAERPHRRV